MDGDELARARARLRLLRVRKSCVSRHCPSKDPRDVWMNTEIVKRNTEMIHKPRKKTYERNNNDDEFKNSKWRESKKKTTRKIFSPVRNGSINHGDYFFFHQINELYKKKNVLDATPYLDIFEVLHIRIFIFTCTAYIAEVGIRIKVQPAKSRTIFFFLWLFIWRFGCYCSRTVWSLLNFAARKMKREKKTLFKFL